MHRLSLGYKCLGVLNLLLGCAWLTLLVGYSLSTDGAPPDPNVPGELGGVEGPRDFPLEAAVVVLLRGAAGVIGFGLVVSGLGLLCGGPGSWRFNQVLLLLSALGLFAAGLKICWDALGGDAQAGMAVPFVAAPLWVWSLVLALSSWSLQRYVPRPEKGTS